MQTPLAGKPFAPPLRPNTILATSPHDSLEEDSHLQETPRGPSATTYRGSSYCVHAIFFCSLDVCVHLWQANEHHAACVCVAYYACMLKENNAADGHGPAVGGAVVMLSAPAGATSPPNALAGSDTVAAPLAASVATNPIAPAPLAILDGSVVAPPNAPVEGSVVAPPSVPVEGSVVAPPSAPLEGSGVAPPSAPVAGSSVAPLNTPSDAAHAASSGGPHVDGLAAAASTAADMEMELELEALLETVAPGTELWPLDPPHWEWPEDLTSDLEEEQGQDIYAHVNLYRSSYLDPDDIATQSSFYIMVHELELWVGAFAAGYDASIDGPRDAGQAARTFA